MGFFFSQCESLFQNKAVVERGCKDPDQQQRLQPSGERREKLARVRVQEGPYVRVRVRVRVRASVRAIVCE